MRCHSVCLLLTSRSRSCHRSRGLVSRGYLCNLCTLHTSFNQWCCQRICWNSSSTRWSSTLRRWNSYTMCDTSRWYKLMCTKGAPRARWAPWGDTFPTPVPPPSRPAQWIFLHVLPPILRSKPLRLWHCQSATTSAATATIPKITCLHGQHDSILDNEVVSIFQLGNCQNYGISRILINQIPSLSSSFIPVCGLHVFVFMQSSMK
jgi:hypothetical protein